MADQIKNLMIGLFVTAAAFIVIFILMFLHPRIGDEGKIIHVRFSDIDKVTIGTRVTYAGKPVGEVVGIDEVKEGRAAKTDSGGHLYIYDLTLRLDSGIKVYNTDEIALRTSGLLGEKNVDITPIAPKEGQELLEIDGQPIYAQQTGTVEETFKEFKEVADKLELALDGATDILNRVRDNNLVEKITHTVENIESITGSLDRPEDWKEIVTNVRNFSQSINRSWVSVDKFLKDVDEAALSITATMNQGKGIFETVSRGEGTLGKFFVSEDVYLRTSSIMSKVETILDDINHYGLLFHSDKSWQRLRARRLNLLQQLSTPQEFRNYFNDEIDQISTSLSRVYMVMNELENDPCSCDVMRDREFTKVFAELMRRVTMLEEEVRLYNTQIVETQVHTTELNPPGCCYSEPTSCPACFAPNMLQGG